MPAPSDDVLRNLLPSIADIGDQRAKSLLDKNLNEANPRRAIRRLHRALRYGRTSLHAAKAFQELGHRYEELGNNRLALLYYTRALRLDLELNILPIPLLYWRGRVHLKSGDREAAHRDFGWAIELDDAPTFFPEEHQLARSMLDAETP